jgi:hypothetical protein
MKGKKQKTNNQKKNQENKQQTKYPKFKCNTVSVSFVVVSSKEEGKNGVWRQLCECLSEAAAHGPPTVSHLLLQALFI